MQHRIHPATLLPMETVQMNGARFRTIFVLILVLAISALFLAVIWPFLKTLLFGAILAGLCQPLFRWLLRRFHGRASLASAVTLIILFLIIAGPVSALVGIVVKQAIEVSGIAAPWIQQQFSSTGNFDIHDWLTSRFPIIADFLPTREEIGNYLGATARTAGTLLVGGVSTFTSRTAGFLLHLFVMIYAMFFFLKDGKKIIEKIFYYMPLSHEDEVLMLQRFSSVTKATVKGTLLIGFIQGTLAGIAFSFAGINGAAFWGAIMIILSTIPGVGSALVWVPAVIYLFITGHQLTAILLAGWCTAVVGTIDNLLRPRLVGQDAEMPDLLILLGTLGGLFLFGPLGLIVGPIVCGLFLTVWDIYGVAFKNILPPVKNLRNLSEATEEPPPSNSPIVSAQTNSPPSVAQGK